MRKQAVLNALEDFATVFFLSGRPALGAAMALAWLLGLVLRLFAVLTR